MTIKNIENYKLPSKEDILENKVNWSIDPEKTILLIHDMQNYFVNFYGDSDLIKEVSKNIVRIKKYCKENGIPVIYTAQPANQPKEKRALLTDFWGEGLKDEEDQKIIELLKPEKEDIVLTKWRYSAFIKTNLLDLFAENNKDTLIITGVYGHIGIATTSCDAFMNDIKSFVVSDAIADFSLKDHIDGLNYVSQRCGVVKSTSQIIKNTNDYKELITKIIGETTPIEKIDLNTNLLEQGLDSIRVMMVTEKLREFKKDINFMDLITKPTINEWNNILIGKEN